MEIGRIEETATPGRRNIPGELRGKIQVSCGCVQGVQGGPSSGGCSYTSRDKFGRSKKDVVEEISVNEEDLQGLVTFQSKESIQDVCVGAALMQEHEGRFFPIAYGSKKLTSAERKYSTIEKEYLATVWGVSKFGLYLAGKPFVLQTDHQPLTFLKDAKFRNDRIMRWALALQGYDYTVKDIPGKDNVVAYYLSRLVVDSENC